MTRHKCMPTRGSGISWFVDGYEQALASAQMAFRETKVPIMIICAPEGELRRVVETVGAENPRIRR